MWTDLRCALREAVCTGCMRVTLRPDAGHASRWVAHQHSARTRPPGSPLPQHRGDYALLDSRVVSTDTHHKARTSPQKVLKPPIGRYACVSGWKTKHSTRNDQSSVFLLAEQRYRRRIDPGSLWGKDEREREGSFNSAHQIYQFQRTHSEMN